MPKTTDGRPRCVSSLRTTLEKAVQRSVGVHVNPHLLRRFAAWLFLQHHPGAYELVRRILGHRSLAVTVSTYTGLEVDAAAKRFDDVVLRERVASRLRALQAFRKPTRIRIAKPRT